MNIVEGAKLTLVEGVQIIELDTRLKKRIIQKKTEKKNKKLNPSPTHIFSGPYKMTQSAAVPSSKAVPQ